MPGNQRPPIPSTPPTFVIAWNGANGTIRTAESIDGIAWSREASHDQVIAASRRFGPAIAHDGAAAWMLMWVNGPELQYITGLGGTTVSAGIIWESSPNIGLINALADSSPALAYGSGRWAVVYKDAAGLVRMVQSQRNSASAWLAPVDVRIGSGGASRPVTTTHAPALAYGTFNGSAQFVLVFKTANQEAQVITSSDGVTWSNPVVIGLERKEPALTIANGILYAALTEEIVSSGVSGFNTIVYKSADGQNWQRIAAIPRTALNVTGPGFAVADCHFLMTEQIGGALGGAFVGISQRRANNISNGCGGGGPGADLLSFGSDEALRTSPGAGIASVGHSGARTMVAFVDTAPPPSNGAELSNTCVTQSGLLEDCPATTRLVAGKSLLLRTTLASFSNGQPAPVTQAWAHVRDAASNALIVSVQGFAFAADDMSLLPAIQHGDPIHFFIPGNTVQREREVFIDVELRRNGDTFNFARVAGRQQFGRNPGISLTTIGYDLQPPGNAVLVAEFLEMARMYPAADGVGSMSGNTGALDASVNQGGVRFIPAPTQPLQVAGPGVPFVNGFVLVNAIQATGPDAAGNICSATAPTALAFGRQFAFNFTVPEEVDGIPGFSLAELTNCQGNPSPLSQRFNNMLTQFNATAMQQKTLVNNGLANDPAKFALNVVTGGNAGQDRSGLIGQCPTGLTSSRVCWNMVGQNFPAVHHELGHSFGLNHNDGRNAPRGPAYHLLNRTRIPNPQVTMRALIAPGNNLSFFLSDEYRRLHDTLFSNDYANLALSPPTAPPNLLAAARWKTAQPVLFVTGSLDAAGKPGISYTRVMAANEIPESGGDELVARLMNGRGKEIARMPFAPDIPGHDTRLLRGVRFFSFAMPFPAGARRLTIERGGTTLIERRISPHPPRLSLSPFPSGRIDVPRTIRWQASDPDGDPLHFDVVMRYPNDKQEPLVLGWTQNEITVDPGKLPGGRGLAIDITASDGFNVGTASILGLEIADHPPEVLIIHPTDNVQVLSGAFVTLRAAGFDREGAVEIAWRSDGDRELGKGETLQTRFMKPGPYIITAEATDQSGQRRQARIHLTVR